MAILVANNATSYLAGTLTAVATSLTVSSGTGTLFPTISGSDVFYVTLTNTSNQNEIVKVTAKSTDTFTIVRAQDGTSALAFAIGDKVELRVIKVVFDDKASLTNDQTFSGANTFSGGILFGAGTAALPSITATGDTNTGIFFPAADTIAFSEGGAEAMRVDSNGDVGIGTTNPVEKLSVVGQISTSGAVGGFLLRDRATSASSSQWYSPSVGNTRLFDTAAAVDRVAIDANGNVGIGTTSLTNFNLRVSKTITGSTSAYGIYADGAIQSDVTGVGAYYSSSGSMASGTLSNLFHYYATQGTIGATVSAQVGFSSSGGLIGATNNYGFVASNSAAVTAGKTAYGFYSAVNTATGGGTTYGFYAAGTAPNYFNGNVGVNETNPTHELTVGGTASATYFNLGANTASAPAVDAAITRPANGTLAFIANAAERMRINSSGNVGIGTTANYRLAVVGGATQLSGSTEAAAGLRIQSISGAATLTGINADNDTNFPIAFVTSATEAMRIDTSNNLKFDSGYGSAATAYGCRAWVCFNGGANTSLTGTYSQSGTTVTVTATAHGHLVGEFVNIDITSGTGVDGSYVITTVANANTFTYTAATSLTTSGNVTVRRNTIRGDGNVDVIADHGLGDYSVFFTTAMPDLTFAAVASAGNGDGTNGYVSSDFGAVRTTRSVRLSSLNAAGTQIDLAYFSVAIFR